MRKQEAHNYVCPETLSKLSLEVTRETDDEIISGQLVSGNGNLYPINNGLPDMTFPFSLSETDADARKLYEDTADVYDEYAPLTFMTFASNEIAERDAMVDDLYLKPDHAVLELGAGTGRDSELIAKRLGPNGTFYVQDLCLKVLEKCKDKLRDVNVPVEFAVSNGCYLPFPDDYFDAVFHFGGINTFSDVKRAFQEINRVTKVGGRVVIGDESMPPWLRKSEFGKVLMNSNPFYRYELPLEHLPVSARDVRLKWIIGSVFYVFDYTVGEGEPEAVLDFEIPGSRGGTHLTRYHGQLEGVTEEAKKLAQRAREKTGMSMHKWLDDVVRKAAERDLGMK